MTAYKRLSGNLATFVKTADHERCNFDISMSATHVETLPFVLLYKKHLAKREWLAGLFQVDSSDSSSVATQM